MLVKKLLIPCLILIVLISSTANLSLADDTPPQWNGWKYKQEIILPIDTSDEHSIYQPIDLQIEFKNPCWAKNEEEHSVRVVCWGGNKWYPLETQIYNLDKTDSTRISGCGIVFLIPKIADGKERYFVHYDSREKDKPNFEDHVSVEDSYYYYEPISGVKTEADYYKITEDGYVVYGVGQKGKVMNRWLSQVILKQKPETKEFGLINSDDLASFSFSYHAGTEDSDEISSDQVLVSKEIITDGNLMVEFKIVSKSYDDNLRSTNYYKYYYCPDGEKRICVNVKHEVFDDLKVSGIVNVDGRYGALFSFKSTSEKLQSMRFGDILPYLHVAGEDRNIREYHMILNPEKKDREWVVSYLDDCDVGEDAWISYDEGKSGKAQAMIFSSNKDLIKSKSKGEVDGIQVKVSEKEYLDVIGAEIDYAAINFGRNSYEPGCSHDLIIPDGFLVEYDVEFYTSEDGGYEDVIKERKYFQSLIKSRSSPEGSGEGDKNIYTLTVTPRLTGRILSSGLLPGKLGFNFTHVYAELYKDGELVSTQSANKPLIGAPNIKFPKLSTGKYTVKIYRNIRNQKNNFIGFESVELNRDTEINVFCTWQKDIQIEALDQKENYVDGVEFCLLKNNTVCSSNITQNEGIVNFQVPFNFLYSYKLIGVYKGLIVYEDELATLDNYLQVNLELYDLSVRVKDTLGFLPDVDLRPFLTSPKMVEETHIYPDSVKYGIYEFKNLPPAAYDLHLSYGSYLDVTAFNIFCNLDLAEVVFPAEYELDFDLLGARGEPISNDGKTITIFRDGIIVANSVSQNDAISLPPGKYSIYVQSEDRGIALYNVVLRNDKDIKIVTSEESILPFLLTALTAIFITQILVLLLIKKISLNTFLKMLAMSLIILSLIQPWWVLNASSTTGNSGKSSEMFIIPQVMIEKVEFDGASYLELATIPVEFTDFLGMLLLIVSVGFVLIGLSFLPNIIYKRRFYKILISSSILFLLLVSLAYYFGMLRITEISLGRIQGSGILEVALPNNKITYMDANWGLGLGFYFCIFAALAALVAGISDYIRGVWFKKFNKNKVK